MGFGITTRDATAGDRSGTVYLLADDAGTCRAEVWPFMGFNCLRWQVRNADGTWGDLLYVAPDWETNPVPTRSGHPVLFPFPNRLRDGRFTFEGKSYQLPLNESTGKHAIHGFTPRNPWRVVGTDARTGSASITGQCRLSKDSPESRGYWPADFSLTLTYQLTQDALSVEAGVENPDTGPLPFGLGYHPYFCIPTAPGAGADEMVLTVIADTVWEAEEGIPTGRQPMVPEGLRFVPPRPIGQAQLDTLFGGLANNRCGFIATDSHPWFVAQISHRDAPGQLTVEAAPAFRELLLFTPPHRRAVAIEPYTCASDAPNLTARGIDSGWQVLPPGGRWAAVVEYRWNSDISVHARPAPSADAGISGFRDR
jgi:aldose 1-epimerase